MPKLAQIEPDAALGLPQDLQAQIDTLLAAPKVRVPKALIPELRGYIEVSGLLPKSIQATPKSTLRAQQTFLALEERFDRVVMIHFDAKYILQRFSAAEASILRYLEQAGVLKDRMSNHEVDRKLKALAPGFYAVKSRWDLVAQLCQDLQRRLELARDTVKMMSKLDDNVRWAQHRSPG